MKDEHTYGKKWPEKVLQRSFIKEHSFVYRLYMQELKSAIMAIFQKRAGWPGPVSAALKNPSQDFKKSFCFDMSSYEHLKRLAGKVRKCLFFYVKILKITV